MRLVLLGLWMTYAGAAQADVPRVAADVAPVQSLVAMVMGDLGAPQLIIPSDASPHHYAMRPSEARALSQADLVVWVGPSLTPWLAGSLGSLATGAAILELQSSPGTTVRTNRSGVAFEAHDDHAEADDDLADVAHDDHAGDAHDDHADVAHDDHADETDGDHAGESHDGHGAGGVDPHMWLDPDNAITWLGTIARALSNRDPENAAVYARNAEAAKAQIGAIQVEIRALLDPLKTRPFVVFHDAYQYFEAHFGIAASAAISLSDGAAPSAARLAEVRDVVQRSAATCVFTEPQFNSGLIDALQTGAALKTAALDPIGVGLTAGPDMYPDLLRQMADRFVTCLGA